MTHYFTDNRSLPQNRKKIEFRVWGFRVYLISDNGVFSKGKIDFGSELLLNNLDPTNMDGKVLDVGCGYGTIGMSLKVANNQLNVDMVDVNDRALELVHDSAILNNVEVNAFKSNMYENVHDTYDYIITNPPIRAGKAIVHGIFEGAYPHLNPGGYLYVVIRKQQGAESAVVKIKEVFGNCDTIDRDKGYWILRAQKK